MIVPLVNDAEQAANAVAACRYPPHGIRYYGLIRASSVMGSRDPEDLARDILCIVMVETRKGLENVEEIAATPGIDGIYIGPADLALSLGLPPSTSVTEAAHIKAVRRIREACRKHGIAAGMHAASGRCAKQHAEAGFDMVTVASDASLLSDTVQRETMAAPAASQPHRALARVSSHSASSSEKSSTGAPDSLDGFGRLFVYCM